MPRSRRRGARPEPDAYNPRPPARAERQDPPVPPKEHDSANPPLLETVNLSCLRGDRLLFEDLAVQAAAGEVVQIHGPNGSGKTTLLRILCGLQPPAGGHVRWRGRDLSPGAPEMRAEVQYVGHAGGVKLDLTPRENLERGHRARRPADRNGGGRRPGPSRAVQGPGRSLARPVGRPAPAHGPWPACSPAAPRSGCSTNPSPRSIRAASRSSTRCCASIPRPAGPR